MGTRGVYTTGSLNGTLARWRRRRRGIRTARGASQF